MQAPSRRKACVKKAHSLVILSQHTQPFVLPRLHTPKYRNGGPRQEYSGQGAEAADDEANYHILESQILHLDLQHNKRSFVKEAHRQELFSSLSWPNRRFGVYNLWVA
jgi:hypothetical protein